MRSRILLTSRKMLCMDVNVAIALINLYERIHESIDREAVDVVRHDMNTYTFETATMDRSLSDASSNSYVADGSNALVRLISSVMRDVQQRNLNAKHSAVTNTATRDESLAGNALADERDMYIGLNKSCSQRKLVEICCAVRTGVRYERDVATIRDESDESDSCREVGTFRDRKFLYVTTTRKQFVVTLSRLSRTPELVFCSAKSMMYSKSQGSETVRRISYLCNFLAYHTFHECERTFDARRLGPGAERMLVLLFLLGAVNAELLRVDRRGNANLSLNMQSLGKAYDDVGFHIFSENSIRHIEQTLVDRRRYSRRRRGTTRDNDKSDVVARDASETPSRVTCVELNTRSTLVDRYLGRVSRVGINSRTLTKRIRRARNGNDAARRVQQASRFEG